MTTPTASEFSQDAVFGRALKLLPPALFDAVKQTELLDPGLLKSYPRTSWEDLKTPGRTDAARRSTASSSAVSPFFPQWVSSTVSPIFPAASYGTVRVGGPVGGGTAGTIVGVCSGLSSLSSSSMRQVLVVSVAPSLFRRLNLVYRTLRLFESLFLSRNPRLEFLLRHLHELVVSRLRWSPLNVLVLPWRNECQKVKLRVQSAQLELPR